MLEGTESNNLEPLRGTSLLDRLMVCRSTRIHYCHFDHNAELSMVLEEEIKKAPEKKCRGNQWLQVPSHRLGNSYLDYAMKKFLHILTAQSYSALGSFQRSF